MINVGDIFLKKDIDFEGNLKLHYYYCIYNQKNDNNNALKEDIIGLLITTNKKMDSIIKDCNDYNVEINLHNKKAYVCCDKIFRFKYKDVKQNKGNFLTLNEKKDIYEHYIKFLDETARQFGKDIEYAKKYHHTN